MRTPFLIDRHQIEHPCTVAGTSAATMRSICHVQFTRSGYGAAVVGTNGHYLVAVTPNQSAPEWKDFPTGTVSLDTDVEEVDWAPFVVDREDLVNALKMLGKGSKKIPILNYILVIPPEPQASYVRLLVPLNGTPQVVECRCLLRGEDRFPDWTKVVAEPKAWKHGSGSRVAFDAGYLDQITDMVRSVSGRTSASQVETNFAFTDRGHEGPLMIYGTSERFVAILMPMRSDLDKGKLNRTAAEWAKKLRSRFVIKGEVPEAEEAEGIAPAETDACGVAAA